MTQLIARNAASAAHTPSTQGLGLFRRVFVYTGLVVVLALSSLGVLAVTLLNVNRAISDASLVDELAAAATNTSRGLGEAILTEGSKSARELVAQSVAIVNKDLPLVVAASPDRKTHVDSWRAIETDIQSFLTLKDLGPGDDDSLIKFGSLQDQLAAFIKVTDEWGEQANFESQAVLKRNFTLLGLALLVVVVTSVLSSAFIVSAIKKSVGGDPAVAVGALREVVKGNLVYPVQLRQGDSSSMLAETSHMQTAIRQIVGGIRDNAASLSAVSDQLAENTDVLKQRSSRTAHQLDQSSKALHNLAESAHETASTASHASDAAKLASELAAKGGEVVGKVVHTMQEINQSSAKIADIIAVIDGIAFQTNILALNAAVEAARAGEHGRGFAVVASEVRALAQRSASAAREIKALIDTSVASVEAGRDHVERAGQTMTDIVGGVDKVTAMIRQIFDAVNQQNGNLEQLSAAVESIDHVTNGNLKSVNEVSAAAAELQRQAHTLMGSVAQFKT